MKVVMICNTDGAMYVFRRPLLTHLVKQGHDVVSVTPNGPYLSRIKQLGVRAHVIDIEQYALSIWTNFTLLIRLFRVLHDEHPDIVHSFTHKPAIFGTIAAYLAGVPKRFITITGLGRLFIRNDLLTRALRWLLLAQYRVACHFATNVFFQNPDDLDFFATKGLVSAKQAQLTYGSGIDLQEFRVPNAVETQLAKAHLAREIACPTGAKRIVLLPARALPEKGIYEFYEAARRVGTLSSDFLFVHVGLISDPSKPAITRKALLELAATCGVHFLGFRENMQDFIAAADIVVLPSAREGMPRALLEALAMGRCIITTDVPGCRLIVRDGWNGHLCRYGDAESLVAALLKVSDDLIAQSVTRSRQHCESLFSDASLVELTMRRYLAA